MLLNKSNSFLQTIQENRENINICILIGAKKKFHHYFVHSQPNKKKVMIYSKNIQRIICLFQKKPYLCTR